MSPRLLTSWFLHQPRCSGLCLFVTVYLSLFVIAGIMLFGSLFQIRGNKISSGGIRRTYNGDGGRSSPNTGRYYGAHGEDDDYQWENMLYSNRSRYHYQNQEAERDGTGMFGAGGVEDIHDRLTATWTGPGLRWPYSNSALINCSSLQEVTELEFVASGWTKAVYKGRYRGRDVAIKTVNLNGHDIQECQEKQKPSSSAASLPVCYRRAAAKILKEIILLTELAHDNIVQVLGSCVPDAVGPVAMVTELGDPLDTVRLLQLSWEDRLRLALGIAQILHHLAHSPLGSLSMNDFRRQQFVLVGGTLKLSDVDDLGVGEPECETDADCIIGSDLTPVSDANETNTTEGLSCTNAHCIGHNERLNIWHAGQHFIRLFLPLSAPASLEPHIQELLAAYAYPAAGGWDSARILGATQRLVARFVSGDYMMRPSTQASSTNGYERMIDSDLPGLYDYRCPLSISAVGCVMSVFNEEEATEICTHDDDCHAVVLGQEHTWTGRTLAVFKNGYSTPSLKKGYSLLVKKKLKHPP